MCMYIVIGSSIALVLVVSCKKYAYTYKFCEPRPFLQLSINLFSVKNYYAKVRDSKSLTTLSWEQIHGIQSLS